MDLAYTTSKGFASFGYENGHIGTNGVASDQNFEFVIDFAWRSYVAPTSSFRLSSALEH